MYFFARNKKEKIIFALPSFLFLKRESFRNVLLCAKKTKKLSLFIGSPVISMLSAAVLLGFRVVSI